MKKALAAIISFVIAAGMISCGTTTDPEAPEEKDTAANAQTTAETTAEQSSEGDLSVETEASSEEAAEGKESSEPQDSDSSEADKEDNSSSEEIRGERESYVTEDELDAALMKKIRGLLEAAAANDEQAYFKLFDTEAYSEVFAFYEEPNEVWEERKKEEQEETFKELSGFLNGSYSGNLKNFIWVETDSYHIDTNGEVYFMYFTIEDDAGDITVFNTLYKNEGKWSVDFNMWTRIDNAFHDFEDIIIEQMNAAAAGDFEKYKECANIDLYIDIILGVYADEEEFGEALTDEEMAEAREDMEEMLSWSYEALNEALGKNFDGKILQVQMFEFLDYEEEGIDLKGAKISDRFVLTVLDSNNEYLEVEGTAYTLDGRMGVWLEPD